MGVKIVSCMLCCLIITSCAASRTLQHDIANEKKYAVAYCLACSYPESVFSEDAEYVSGAYIQKGEFDLAVYEKIRDFVANYKKIPYLSKHQRDLDIMQCIDLFESKELTLFIEKNLDNFVLPEAK